MDVLLVAAKEKIADYTGVIHGQDGTGDCRRRRLRCRTPTRSITGSAPRRGRQLNAGAGAIHINIITGNQSVFTRDISMGGSPYRGGAEGTEPAVQSAEQIKRGQAVGVSRSNSPRCSAMTENVLLEIRRPSTSSRRPPPRITSIASSDSGASRVGGFTASLQERFGTRRRNLRPFKMISFDRRARDRGSRGLSATAAVAVGLAHERRATDDSHRPSRCRRDKSKRSGHVWDRRPETHCRLSLILVLAVLFIGWRCWALAQSGAIDAEIGGAAGTTRLHSVINPVQQFGSRRRGFNGAS
jgi:hypothetical protein